MTLVRWPRHDRFRASPRGFGVRRGAVISLGGGVDEVLHRGLQVGVLDGEPEVFAHGPQVDDRRRELLPGTGVGGVDGERADRGRDGAQVGRVGQQLAQLRGAGRRSVALQRGGSG
jgi:hypothetical protein